MTAVMSSLELGRGLEKKDGRDEEEEEEEEAGLNTFEVSGVLGADLDGRK